MSSSTLFRPTSTGPTARRAGRVVGRSPWLPAGLGATGVVGVAAGIALAVTGGPATDPAVPAGAPAATPGVVAAAPVSPSPVAPGPAASTRSAEPAGQAVRSAPPAQPAKASVSTTLRLISAAGARSVVVSALTSGTAPLTLDGALGSLNTDPESPVQGVVVDFGDGAKDGADPGTAVCAEGTPLRRFRFSNTLRHTYSAPGTYTLTYTVRTCVPGKDDATTPTTRSLKVVVTQGPAAAAPVTTLRLTSAPGERAVTVAARTRGTVPMTVDGSTVELNTGPQAWLMGTAVDFGDGSVDGSDPGTATCSSGTPLTTVDLARRLAHTYAKAGTYTLTYTMRSCVPGTDTDRPTTATLQVVVR
ncbi:hypothetical protein [Kineosporia sp. A_224]|uniref:hypothetical protein n=1 Tax=Kineosporia sp. A_224 TaxID=1962180 RepID=UPI000B4A9B1C|nr:hypothetical protein [Kineosporia sp. A_224]